jgi:DNA modification methylase
VTVILYHGDCLQVLAEMEENSIDTTITDPPYGLGKEPDIIKMLEAWLADEEYGTEGHGFMSQKWDAFVPGPRYWKAVFRVMKPGGTLLAFGGTRTNDLLTLAIRMAGFKIRDTLMWVYGSGFPKATDISKQLDKNAGMEREVIGLRVDADGRCRASEPHGETVYSRDKYGQDLRPQTIIKQATAPATPSAQLWDGWKSHGLKPAYEPILVCQKPLTDVAWPRVIPSYEPIILAMKPNDSTYASNALKFGISGLWIDGARIPTNGDKAKFPAGVVSETENNYGNGEGMYADRQRTADTHPTGRYPANLILECNCGAGQGGKHAGTCVCGMLDRQSGERPTGVFVQKGNDQATHQPGGWRTGARSPKKFVCGDKGGCSRYFKNIPVERFFYTPKAPRSQRWFYCPTCDDAFQDRDEHKEHGQLVSHPTQKPQALLSYLCTLTRTPTGGIVLDPFLGSGTTGVAAVNTDRPFVGIEINEEYFKIAERRIEHAKNQARQLELI